MNSWLKRDQCIKKQSKVQKYNNFAKLETKTNFDDILKKKPKNRNKKMLKFVCWKKKLILTQKNDYYKIFNFMLAQAIDTLRFLFT